LWLIQILPSPFDTTSHVGQNHYKTRGKYLPGESKQKAIFDVIAAISAKRLIFAIFPQNRLVPEALFN